LPGVLARGFVPIQRKRLARANTPRQKEAVRIERACALSGFIGVPVVPVLIMIRVRIMITAAVMIGVESD
jgi:hypothetical protein